MSFGKMPPHLLRMLIAFCLLMAVRQEVRGWTSVTVHGREYIPISEVQDFYGFNLAAITADTIRLVKPGKVFTAQVGTRDLFLNNLRFYLNLPVILESGIPCLSRLDLTKIVDPVLRPERIHGGPIRTVVLDAGHGGNDQGTWSYYGTEKLYTLEVVQQIAPLLRAQGLNVILTRSDDRFISLEERVEFTNRIPNALFVSVHFNSGPDARGIETYALTPRGVPSSDNKPTLIDFLPSAGNEHDAENVALATAVHGCILREIRLPDRGIRRARFHVLKNVRMPGVLVEGGYLGGLDAFVIAQPRYRQMLAESIAKGIGRYLSAVPFSNQSLPMAALPAAPDVKLPDAAPAATLVQSATGADTDHAPSP